MHAVPVPSRCSIAITTLPDAAKREQYWLLEFEKRQGKLIRPVHSASSSQTMREGDQRPLSGSCVL